MKALFESINLIGDALYISPALREWIIRNEIGLAKNKYLDVTVLTLNDHVAPLYTGMVSDLMNEKFKTFSVIFDVPETEHFDFRWKFDVNEAFKVSDRKKQHLAKSYADLLGIEIPATYAALKPIFIPRDPIYWTSLDLPIKDAVLVSMFSASCTSRDKKTPGLPPNKMLPWDKWRMMLLELRKQYPAHPIRVLGAPEDKIPDELDELCVQNGIEPMFGIPLNELALIMRNAKLLVTIDNGMSHLAASQETPTFLMYPMCLGTHYILPIGNPNMVYVQMNPVTVKSEYLHMALQFAIKKFKEKK